MEGSGKRRKVWLMVTGVVVAVVLLIVILALTVFKVKKPVTTMESVKPENFDMDLDRANQKVELNMTLNMNVSIKNPNKVGFKYSSSTAFLKYRGEVIGEVPFPDGKISSSETKQYNLNLTLLADRLFFNSQLYSDVISGTLPLNIFVRISGKVSIIAIQIHVVSSTSCDVAVQISSKTINQDCQSKTKL